MELFRDTSKAKSMEIPASLGLQKNTPETHWMVDLTTWLLDFYGKCRSNVSKYTSPMDPMGLKYFREDKEKHKKLVGGWTTHQKNMLVKLKIFTNLPGENKQILETTHQLIGRSKVVSPILYKHFIIPLAAGFHPVPPQCPPYLAKT